jgi:hypothetical protein
MKHVLINAAIVIVASCAIACGDDDDRSFSHEGMLGAGIPFELVAGIPMTKVRVNGSEEKNFIVDTGAQAVLIGDELAEEIGYKSGLFGAPVDTLSIGDLDIHNAIAIRYDLATFGAALGVQIDGFLGATLFQNFTVAFDYHDRRLFLLDGTDEQTAGILQGASIMPEPLDAPIDVTIGFALVEAELEPPGTKGQYLVDSGASATILLDSYFQTIAGTDHPQLTGGEVTGQLGMFDFALTRFCGLQVGEANIGELVTGIVPDELLAQLKPIFPDLVGVLGYTFLREMFVVIDYPKKALRMYRYSDRSHIPANELVQVGIAIRRDGNDVVVTNVFAGSNAEQMGIMTGDRLLRIDGMNVTTLSDLQIVEALTGEAGTEVELALLRDTMEMTVRVQIERLLPACPM